MVKSNINHIASHCDLCAPKGLTSLWIEIPDYCHLHCGYCFASTNRNKRRNSSDWLQKQDYLDLIDQFANQGGKFIGIPGRGEPFYDENEELVKTIVTHAFEKGLTTTIFTTGDTLLFHPKLNENDGGYRLNSIRRSDDEEDLIDFLGTRNVILLIKYNSKQSSVQDRIVDTAGYTTYRTLALEELERKQKEHKDDKTWNLQIGIVTSILKSNIDEIGSLYDRFNPNTGYIFDCDTLLPRGRGESYKSTDNLSHEDLNKTFALLKEKGAIPGCPGGTYIGVSCDRIFHHLYVSLNGDVYPCIGCFENNRLKKDLCLGNIKQDTLIKCNDSVIKRNLRENPSGVFDGVCINCQNFKNQECFSCLGRCAINVTTKGNNIRIDTCGCTNHRPVFSEWINRSVDYLRMILSHSETQDLLEQNLEKLWMPNRNLSFKWHQLQDNEREIEFNTMLASDKDEIETNHSLSDSIDRFSLKKHYKYSDLWFPLNKVWDFIKQPSINERIWNKENRSQLFDKFSESYLSNIFLPSLKILLEKHDYQNPLQPSNDNVLACNIMFYDNIRSQYFYRTISKGNLESSDNHDFEKSLILFRWAETFRENDNYFSFSDKKGNGKIFNVSSILRNELYKEYELILTDELEELNVSDNRFNFSNFISSKLITERISCLETFFQEKVFNEGGYWDSVKNIINTKIFCELQDGKEKLVKQLFTDLNSCLFDLDKRPTDSQILPGLKSFIENNCVDEKIKLKVKSCSSMEDLWNINVPESPLSKFLKVAKEKLIPTLNYVVFLGYLNKLGINHYTLFHSPNFKNTDNNIQTISNLHGYGGVIDPSGILICSKQPLSHDFRSDLLLFISNIFQPLDEFYFNKLIFERESFLSRLKAYQHTIFNLFPHTKHNIEWIKKELDMLFDPIRNPSLPKSSEAEIKLLKERSDSLDVLIKEEIFNLRILDVILLDCLDKQQENQQTYVKIIEQIQEYCILLRDDKYKNEIGSILYPEDTSVIEKIKNLQLSKGEKYIDVFMIFYHLMVIANKASFYKYRFDISIMIDPNNRLKIIITSYGAPLSKNVCEFINGKRKDPPRMDSGLAIICKKIHKLGWSTSAHVQRVDKLWPGSLKNNVIKISFKVDEEN